jgi:DNA-binding HxlR family transcriptional regulator
LREFESDGVVHRKVYAQVQPKVEYSLSKLGLSLELILVALRNWGDEIMLEDEPKPLNV